MIYAYIILEILLLTSIIYIKRTSSSLDTIISIVIVISSLVFYEILVNDNHTWYRIELALIIIAISSVLSTILLILAFIQNRIRLTIPFILFTLIIGYFELMKTL